MLQGSWTGRLAVALFSVLAPALLACCQAASETGDSRIDNRRWEREIRRRGVDPQSIENPLAYTPEMREVASRAAGSGGPLEKLRRLQDYLFDKKQFPFNFESSGTHTAVEAFETRNGNCVSFTSLFIALARSVGIEAAAALLVIPGDIERERNLIVVNNHIVAIYEHGGGATVFDFNLQRESERPGLRVLDDLEITAVYLNNLGAAELFGGHPDSAERYLEDAIKIAPGFSPAYGNLGVLKRQAGDTAGALDAYRRALEFAPRDPTILNNLAALYRSMGLETEARSALRAADLRQASAYMFVARGDLELVEKRYRRAKRLYRIAARMARNSPEPLLGIARVEIARGRYAAARKALLRALDDDPDNELAHRLMEKVQSPD